MIMGNNNAFGQILPTNPALIFPATVDTPGFTAGKVTYDGISFTYSGLTSPGLAAFNVEYIAWGGNVIQFGDVGISGGSSDPTNTGITEIDFAVAHLGVFRFLCGNNVPGIVQPLVINETGVFCGSLRFASLSAPTANINANAGTGASVSILTGSDSAFRLSLTAGTAAITFGIWCHVTFATAFAAIPSVVVFPQNAPHTNYFSPNAIALNISTTGFDIYVGNSGGALPPASANVVYSIMVQG